MGSTGTDKEVILYSSCGSVGLVTHAYTNFSDIKVNSGGVMSSGNACDDEKNTVSTQIDGQFDSQIL